MKRRAAIYARYSSDLQRDRSIEDQMALCRAAAARSGFTVVVAYDDRAASGASVHGRPGLQALMQAARADAFDVLIVENLDRLSRDQEDLPAIYKRLTFAGIDIMQVDAGGSRADQITVGVRAIVGALYLTDLAHKVRRGLAGVVRDGRYAGGCPYGYRVTPGEPGNLQLDPEAAAIVQRIFREYVAGKRPRAIAQDLNRDGIAPPRGTQWNASTINGNAKRGNGIILNQVYVGTIVWNRLRMIKHPDTGRRISKVNPESEQHHAEAPQLRIIDDETWQAAQAIKQARGGAHPYKARAPRHLLSGLLRCAACGSGMSSYGRDSCGSVRIRCSAEKESKSCPSPRTFRLDRIEALVLSTLREQLTSREAIRYYLKTYNAQREERARLARAEHNRMQERLDHIAAEHERIMRGYIKGFIGEAEAEATLPSLRAERDRITATLAAEPEARVVSLHPAAVDRYLAAIENLSDALAAGDIASSVGAREALRELIERVIVLQEPRHTAVEIHGHLARLIGGSPYPHNVGLKVVAEAGYRLMAQPVPGTFRVVARART